VLNFKNVLCSVKTIAELCKIFIKVVEVTQNLENKKKMPFNSSKGTLECTLTTEVQLILRRVL
jgi:hypothetical protein